MSGKLFPKNGKWYFKYQYHLDKPKTFAIKQSKKSEAKAVRYDFVGRMARGEFTLKKEIRTTDWIRNMNDISLLILESQMAIK